MTNNDLAAYPDFKLPNLFLTRIISWLFDISLEIIISWLFDISLNYQGIVFQIPDSLMFNQLKFGIKFVEMTQNFCSLRRIWRKYNNCTPLGKALTLTV